MGAPTLDPLRTSVIFALLFWLLLFVSPPLHTILAYASMKNVLATLAVSASTGEWIGVINLSGKLSIDHEQNKQQINPPTLRATCARGAPPQQLDHS